MCICQVFIQIKCYSCRLNFMKVWKQFFPFQIHNSEVAEHLVQNHNKELSKYC